MLRIMKIVITSNGNYYGFTLSGVDVIIPGHFRRSSVKTRERHSCISSLKDCDSGKR